MTVDPFRDRMARDIRNSLSTALVEELTGQKKEAVAEVAGRWMSDSLPDAYHDYIESHQRLYREAIVDIRTAGLTDPRLQAVALWNAGLYFELHELLETLWTSSRGGPRTALKAVIQAAGAYVHHRRGKPEAGRKLAGKALVNLEEGKEYLGFIANLDALVIGLQHLPDDPPVLLAGCDESGDRLNP